LSLIQQAEYANFLQEKTTIANGSLLRVEVKQTIYTLAYRKVIDPVNQLFYTHLPQKTWENITPVLFVAFWSLSLYDLFLPAYAYKAESERIEKTGFAQVSS